MPEEAGRPSRPAQLSQDALVDDLRPSPTDPPPDVLEVRGFLGHDTEDGYWRLYLSADLDVYLRIAEADIVASRQRDSEEISLNASSVVIRASATVEKVQTIPLKTQASFLQGVYTAALSAAADSRSGVADAMGPRRQRVRRGPDPRLDYPASGSWICQPQITIEVQTCFCTIDSVACCWMSE
jgi:hypothetical protein